MASKARISLGTLKSLITSDEAQAYLGELVDTSIVGVDNSGRIEEPSTDKLYVEAEQIRCKYYAKHNNLVFLLLALSLRQGLSAEMSEDTQAFWKLGMIFANEFGSEVSYIQDLGHQAIFYRNDELITHYTLQILKGDTILHITVTDISNPLDTLQTIGKRVLERLIFEYSS
jgi:hypothetical protein